MSIYGFSGNINNLTDQKNSLEQQVNTFKQSLQNKNLTLSNAEDSHKKITAVYEQIMETITNFKNKFNSNQSEISPALLNILNVEDRCGALLTQLNDELLTNYPTAKIAYGRTCINPQKPINTTEFNLNIQQKLKDFSSMREIRGDGNCFLSSFTVQYLEKLVEKKSISTFINFIYNEQFSSESLKTEIISTLLHINENPSQIESIFSDNTKILPFIKYFRMIAADEMKINKEQFEYFFKSDIEDIFKTSTNGKSYDRLIEEFVLKMGVDFSHPSITALCQKLGFSITIIDQKLGRQEGVNVLDNSPSQGTFCRNGAHYYILYKKTSEPSETVIQCQIPFGHTLFIRGEGGILNYWNQGKPLTMIDTKTWSLPSSALSGVKECKFVLNNTTYEIGNNRTITNGKLEHSHSPDFGPLLLEEIQDKPTISNQINITVEYDAGWGNQLGVCHEPNWEKAPIILSPANNCEWTGQIPANSNWKFVKIHQEKITAWEDHSDRKCDGTSSSVHYKSGTVKF